MSTPEEELTQGPGDPGVESNPPPETPQAPPAPPEDEAEQTPQSIISPEAVSAAMTLEEAQRKARDAWMEKHGENMRATQTHITSNIHKELGIKPDGYTYIAESICRFEGGHKYMTQEFVAARLQSGWEYPEPSHPSQSAAVPDMTVVMRMPTLIIQENYDRGVQEMEAKLADHWKSEATSDGAVDKSKVESRASVKTMREAVDMLPDEDPSAEDNKPLSDEDINFLEQ